MKKIGFLSFGHWTASPQSQTRSAADTLLQSIELAVAAEQLGADGAYFRVHHFARQLASPFPLLAAVGAKTSRIEIGTAVIDMRYENPLYMIEDASAADLIAGGRLQLGISRGSPEQVIDGWRYFGYRPAEGQGDADMGRNRRKSSSICCAARVFAHLRRRCFRTRLVCFALEPLSEGLRERIWWGAGSNATAVWATEIGMNLRRARRSRTTRRENPSTCSRPPRSGPSPRQRKEAGAAAPPAPPLGASRSILGFRRQSRPRVFRTRTGR